MLVDTVVIFFNNDKIKLFIIFLLYNASMELRWQVWSLWPSSSHSPKSSQRHSYQIFREEYPHRAYMMAIKWIPSNILFSADMSHFPFLFSFNRDIQSLLFSVFMHPFCRTYGTNFYTFLKKIRSHHWCDLNKGNDAIHEKILNARCKAYICSILQEQTCNL